MLPALPPARELLADRGYDSNRFRAVPLERGITPCIPPIHSRKIVRIRRIGGESAAGARARAMANRNPCRQRLPPSSHAGWLASYYTKDYAAQATAFQAALSGLICEGVFTKFPRSAHRADRIRRIVAARASLATDEILAWPAPRGAVGRSLAHRDRPRQRAPDDATTGRTAGCRRAGA